MRILSPLQRWSALSRPRQLLWAGVGAAGLVLLLVLLPERDGDLRTPGTLPSQAVEGPVVLVPGLGGARGGLEALATRLQQAGRTTFVLTDPGGSTGDLDAQAQFLAAEVERLAAQGAPSVDVVGYSAGGVVARLYIRRYQGALRVRRLVTLGSPHHGTETADAGAILAPGACPLACAQLTTDSEILEELNSVDETPTGPRYVSIFTEDDETVRPVSTSKLTGGVNVLLQDVCEELTVSHSALPTEPLVVALTLRALGPGLSDPPDSSSCEALRVEGR